MQVCNQEKNRTSLVGVLINFLSDHHLTSALKKYPPLFHKILSYFGIIVSLAACPQMNTLTFPHEDKLASQGYTYTSICSLIAYYHIAD